MTPQTISRVPSGVPSGGQFAASAKADAAGVALAEQQEPTSPLGQCPDCLAPMFGHLGGDRFVPGSECTACPHVAASWEVDCDVFDEDDASLLFEFDDEGLIRVTDDYGNTVDVYHRGSADWSANLGTFGFEGCDDAIEAAFAARDEPRADLLVGNACRAAGADHMGEVYQVILDRENVSAARLAALTADDVEGHYNVHLAHAVDTLASDYATGYDDDDPDTWPSDADMDLVAEACEDLPVMTAFYEILNDRGCLGADDANALHANDVHGDYESRIAPAIDRLEDELRQG